MSDNSDLMYRLLVQSVVDYAIYMLRPDGIVANWNSGAQRAKGYTAEEIVGQHFSRFYSPDDRQAGLPERGLATAAREGRFEAEGWRLRKDGTSFWAHVVIDAIHGESGELLGFAKVTRDCTEQRASMLAQRDQERKFRLLVQGVTDYAIYMLDPGGHVVNWNAGAERAKGYTAEEIVGQHFSRFYLPEDRESGLPAQGLATALREGRFQAQGQRVRKDGSIFWAHVVIDPIYNEDREFIGFAKITRDITERRLQELALLEAKELAENYSAEMAELSAFLESVIANIPSAVIVQNAVSRQVLLINLQAERLLGCSRAEVEGKPLRDCLSRELADYVERLTDHSLRAEALYQQEDTLHTALGRRVLHSRTLTIRGKEPNGTFVLLIADDVTEERAVHAQMHHMAHHDALTSLPNRTLFRERLNEALLGGDEGRHYTAVLCLDLDNFKNVNDALGHQVGDSLLRSLAARLVEQVPRNGTLARLGGDEFAVILPRLDVPADAEQVAQRLIHAISPSFLIDGHKLSVGLSVGIALAPLDKQTPDQLLRCADMALYEAKRNGRNRFERFQIGMDEVAHKRRALESDLREAISGRQLQLYYQPIIAGPEAEITGYEALMRWMHPTRGMVMPMDFIPIAEETGLIHDMGALALHMACREAASWEAGRRTVAVNLSPVQFKSRNLVATVAAALRESGLAADRLELEITESVLLDDSEGNLSVLQHLKTLGVRIALDDFGTGYSSLSYLRSFPFDKIKIDKSFISDMNESRESLAIIRAITGMGSSLQIQTTAEGVETQEQFDRLVAEGCSHFQGYLFGRPQPADKKA